MRRLRILTQNLSVEDRAALTTLAEKAAFRPSEIELIDNVIEPDCQCDDEIILILINQAIYGSPALEDALIAAQRGSRRAVLVWPEGAQALDPPTAAKKYAYSIIRYDADTLRLVAENDDELCFEKDNGEPLPKPETERNCCVDERKVLQT